MSRFFKAPEHQKPKFGWDAGQKSFNERVGPGREKGGENSAVYIDKIVILFMGV